MIFSLLQRVWEAKENRHRRRHEKSGSMLLSASLGDELTAHLTLVATAWNDAKWRDARSTLAPIVTLDRVSETSCDARLRFESVVDLVLFQKRLTNWCYEHRVALNGGTFDFAHSQHTGRLRATVTLAIGDRPPWLLVQLGGLPTTYSIREAIAAYEAMNEACNALLRAWGVTAVDITPVTTEEGGPRDERIDRELAEACARGRSELLEVLQTRYMEHQVRLAPTEVVLSYAEQGRQWWIQHPVAAIDELRDVCNRVDAWARANDVAIEATPLTFLPVLAPEFFIPLPSLAPRDWDQEMESVRWRGQWEDPDWADERIVFRISDDQMMAGIRTSETRVWILLEPKKNRVVKSSDDEYTLTHDDLARLRRAAKMPRAVEDELAAHLVERAPPPRIG